MEQFLLERLHLHLAPQSDAHCRLQALDSARSLLTNLYSSDSTRRAVSDALLRSVDHHSRDSIYLRRVIKLLGDAAALHRPLTPSVFGAVRPLLEGGECLAVDALAVLASLADSVGKGEEGLCLTGSALDEDLILSLAASAVVSVRSGILNLLVGSVKMAQSCILLPVHFMLQVLLGLAVDLYPSVRRAALDGLVALSKKYGSGFDSLMIECCYSCAVMLLRDEEESVRLSAVRLVSECGRMFAEEGVDNSQRMDLIFVQLSSMARDMSMKVRVETFIALGRLRLVSQSALLQSLSKKVSWIKCGKKTLSECFIQESKFTVSCAAGAFVHGIEDEFYEVRTAACKSLGKLTVFSIKFADDALNLLMDMLNDDASAVRLQTLQTLFYMATNDRLAVQERHMHMFLGLLADISALIRSAARKVLRLMRIPEPEIFKSTIDGLIANMEAYPEEEEDIFLVLFLIGKNHGEFATRLVKEFAKELIPSCDGELSLDSPRVAALLVLAIPSPFSDKQLACDIPASVFSYAVPLLGRISLSLRHVIDQDSLMAYLFRRSGMPFSATRLNSKGADLLPNIDQLVSNYTKQIGEICRSSEIRFKEHEPDLSEISTTLEQSRMEVEVFDEETMQSVKLILETVAGTWKLIQSHCTFEALRTLRICKEELEMIVWDAGGSVSAVLAFASQYVEVIQLVAKIWEQLKPVVGMVSLDLLLEQLDMSLRRMRYGFPGLCREGKCRILELILLASVLRLYKVGACSYSTLKKLQVIISRLELLCIEGSSTLSPFAEELKRICSGERSPDASYPFPVRNLLEIFSLEPTMPFVGGFRHIKAELQAPGNDSENPLPFVSGLPVGITFQIKLHNISDDERPWLRMAVDDLIQYVFLDLRQFEGSEQARRCVVSLPFYATPRAASCLLSACVCMECPLEDVADQTKGRGGPKHDITLVCDEIDVYLVGVENRWNRSK